MALSHQRCAVARGCGCLVDRALAIINKAEADLFTAEIDSYADPLTPRSIREPDNSIAIVEPPKKARQ